MNDLKALRQINLDSQFEQVKVFRLYSAYTLEEKLLMLTKQGTTPDGNVRNIRRSICHEFLTWGAYYLFEKLEDFHSIITTDGDSVDSHGNSFVEDVFHELSILLPNNDKSDVDTKSSSILQVQQIEGAYCTDIFLAGEVGYSLMDNFSVIEEMLTKEPPCIFWINILEGRRPSWKHFCCQSSRTRKSVQSLDGTSKKCRTEAGSTACQTSGEAAAPRSTQTPILDKPSSMKLHSLLPFDDHNTEIQSDHQLESKCPSSETSGEFPVQTAQRASNTREDVSALETSQVTHVEVLQSLCKALQTEMEKLEKLQTESLEQHEDMKLQSRMACEREVEQIQKKYEAMLQTADAAFQEEKEALDTRYNKIFVNKALAEALMQRDSKNASLTQVATKFSLEQAYRLISQRPQSRAGQGSPISRRSVASPDLSHVQAGDLRAPAPHLRHSLPCTVPTLSSERSRITYSPVSLEQVRSPLPALLPP